MGDWSAVAEAVNDRMRARGITQRELSEKSGISPATLRQIQHGVDRQRSRSTLAAISRALGLPDDHLHYVSVGDTRAQDAPAPAALGELRDELASLRKRVEAIELQLNEKS